MASLPVCCILLLPVSVCLEKNRGQKKKHMFQKNTTWQCCYFIAADAAIPGSFPVIRTHEAVAVSSSCAYSSFIPVKLCAKRSKRPRHVLAASSTQRSFAGHEIRLLQPTASCEIHATGRKKRKGDTIHVWVSYMSRDRDWKFIHL